MEEDDGIIRDPGEPSACLTVSVWSNKEYLEKLEYKDFEFFLEDPVWQKVS